jgi:hypothetical protein
MRDEAAPARNTKAAVSGKKEGNHSRIVPFTKVQPEGAERLVASRNDLLA